MGLLSRFDKKDYSQPAEGAIKVDFESPDPGLEPSPEEKTREGEKRKVLRTENLVKKYGKRTVANHVSINVTQGEIVGLLGPNGAGKTTTFYMTVGLITPNEGQIFLDDLNITKFPVYKRAQNGIGYLAQEPSVFRKLSVENNIRSVLEMTNTSKEYQQEKLESLITEFRLQKVRKNLGDQLSGGERRRTEIARCLAINPDFIMLDEPFAGVDPIAVEDIQEVVYKLKSKNSGGERGAAVLTELGADGVLLAAARTDRTLCYRLFGELCAAFGAEFLICRGRLVTVRADLHVLRRLGSIALH